MDDWIGMLLACRRRSEPAVLVSVAAARGSVPREPGTRMVVTALRQYGTIGGGHLEWEAVASARGMLADGRRTWRRRLALGAALGQCCGGVVELMFEAIEPAAGNADWLDEVERCLARGEACVLVSAAGEGTGERAGESMGEGTGEGMGESTGAGSGKGTGRGMPAGASWALVVTAARCVGSLGSDAADAAARTVAAEILGSGTAARLVELSAGGPTYLFDPMREPVLDIVLFGAGHVGQALVKILGNLPCRVTWIDERAELFPEEAPANVRIEVSDSPVAEVKDARPGACFLVMTHSHALDQALAEAILQRGDFRYFGLIGSLSKRHRFERRLGARGVTADALARMTCPIGIDGIDGKAPAVIAVAVAAQLLSLNDRVVRLASIQG